MVKLRTLGECVIEVGENRIAPDSKVVFALLLYLGLERGKRFTRTALMEMFWPDSPPAKAAHSLRQTIYQCRKLGAPIATTKTDVHFRHDDVASDLDSLAPARRNGSRILMREFLPSYTSCFSELYAAWLDEQRSMVGAKIRRGLLTELTQLKTRGDWEVIETVAGNLLKLDPLNEEATLVLAEAAAMRGNKVGAVRILERFASEVGGDKYLQLPATILRKRIGEQFKDDDLQNNPFVGRSDTMEFLNRQLDRAKHGDGSCLLVWGEPGMGKSRLVSEFHKTVKLQGFQTVKVDCQLADANRPLSAFVEAVPFLMQLRGSLGCSPHALALLGTLISHTFDDAGSNSHPTPEVDGPAHLTRAITDLVDAVLSEAPLVLIIEDVHWLDGVSWETLAQLAKACSSRRLLLALTSREKHPRNAPNEGYESITKLALSPLTNGDAQALFYQSGSITSGDLAEGEERWFITAAEGNPYFVRELARHFADTGQTYAIPPSLESLLSGRLRNISSSALRLLQVCALLGRHSTFDRIERVLQTEPFKLVEALEDLELHELVTTESTRVNARHSLLADQAIHLCTPGTKRLLHRRIAMVLEDEVLENHSAALLWACAEQWQLAGEAIRGSRVARSCGSHLMGLGLATEAIAILEHASAIATDTQERYEMLRSLGDAYHAGKHWTRAADVLAQARVLSKSVSDAESLEHSDEELRLLDVSWRGELNRFADRGCNYYITRIRDCLRSKESTPSHRLAAVVKGLIFADADFDVQAMDELYGSARSIISDDRLSLHDRLLAKLIYETCRGEIREGVTAGRALISEARKYRQTFELLLALTNACVPLRFSKAFEEAEQYLTEAASIAQDRKLWNSYVGALDSLATIKLNQDRIAEAREVFSKIEAVAHLVDDNIAVMSLARMRCQVLIADGDFQSARASFTPAEREFSIGMSRGRNEAQSLQVILDIEAGRPAKIQFLEDLEHSHMRARTAGKQDWIVAALVVGLRGSLRSAEADNLFQQYLSTYRRECYPYPQYLQRIIAMRTGASAERKV